MFGLTGGVFLFSDEKFPMLIYASIVWRCFNLGVLRNFDQVCVQCLQNIIDSLLRPCMKI